MSSDDAFHLGRTLALALVALIGITCGAPVTKARLVDGSSFAASLVGEPVTLTCTPWKPDPRARTDCRTTGVDRRILPIGALWVVRDSKGEIVSRTGGWDRFALFPGTDAASVDFYVPWHLVSHRYLADGRIVWRLHHRFALGRS